MPTKQTQRKNAVIHKTYRDVSAEERQAVEGSATAWAAVLQNDVKPSSKAKQNTKPVDKSRQLNPPSGIAEEDNRSYGDEQPVQQQEEKTANTAEENAPAYGSDIAENMARMASGGNREAWLDNAAEQKANEAAKDKMPNTSNDDVVQNIVAGQKAIADIMKNHKEVVNAMYRPEVGGIDFVYGEVGTDAKNIKMAMV